MNQIALRSDFSRLPTDVQLAHIEVLRVCERGRLTCRCESNGRDFSITIGRGMSSARYWLDMYEPACEDVHLLHHQV